MHAGGSFSRTKPAVAHVTFAHDAFFLVILRDFVRTFHYAIRTTDALVIEMMNDAGDGIFFVGEDGASVETRRINAMMTGSGDMLLKCGT